MSIILDDVAYRVIRDALRRFGLPTDLPKQNLTEILRASISYRLLLREDVRSDFNARDMSTSPEEIEKALATFKKVAGGKIAHRENGRANMHVALCFWIFDEAKSEMMKTLEGERKVNNVARLAVDLGELFADVKHEEMPAV